MLYYLLKEGRVNLEINSNEKENLFILLINNIYDQLVPPLYKSLYEIIIAYTDVDITGEKYCRGDQLVYVRIGFRLRLLPVTFMCLPVGLPPMLGAKVSP